MTYAALYNKARVRTLNAPTMTPLALIQALVLAPASRAALRILRHIFPFIRTYFFLRSIFRHPDPSMPNISIHWG